ncbi:MAG TPA: zinc ribbon domain-containing protein [Gemmatimonadaceae bacterium]|jgi:putative FmdB family regulatory protein|nr:zinc ribbon domain-containing protein [Gemmatimonadaceae bacterium]
MPTYEFRCPEGHDFEKFYRSIAGAPREVLCPTCGKTAERQMSPAGLVFKGTGFYITDYGKDGKKSKSGSGSEGSDNSKNESAPKSDAPSSSDAKPAAESKPPAPAPAPAEKPSSGKKKTNE